MMLIFLQFDITMPRKIWKTQAFLSLQVRKCYHDCIVHQPEILFPGTE